MAWSERQGYNAGYAAGGILASLVEGLIYLIGYLFSKLEDKRLTLALPLRFEHMHVCAGSGHGKTQTLQYLIATHDLRQGAAAVPPRIIWRTKLRTWRRDRRS